jgi:hypothetical protein
VDGSRLGTTRALSRRPGLSGNERPLWFEVIEVLEGPEVSMCSTVRRRARPAVSTIHLSRCWVL